MMLDHLGETPGAELLTSSFEAVLADNTRTGDLGGTASTQHFTQAVLQRCHS